MNNLQTRQSYEKQKRTINAIFCLWFSGLTDNHFNFNRTMNQNEIDKMWANRPAPNKVKATAYGLHAVREFDKRAQALVKAVKEKEVQK